MLAFSTDLATVLYLLPVFLLWLCRARRDMDAAEAAVLVAVAVAGDLLATLLVAHVLPLQTAVIVVRAAWVLGASGYLVMRWRRAKIVPALPRWVDVWLVLEVVVAAYIASKLSMDMSRECHNADRGWHIPLVTSLSGQSLPFRNVYDPRYPLAYHYTGDVLGVMMQTLSGMRLHSSLALTLARDTMYGLIGASLALTARSLGYRGVTAAVLAGLALLLAGPMTVVTHEPKLVSYSYVNFYRVSFRPHASLSALLVVGIVVSMLARVRNAQPARFFSLAIAICVAAMAITDEAAIALVGLALGCAWLVYPKVLGDKWWHGLIWLGALLVAVTLPQIIFSGSLSAGAPKHELELVPPRASGYLKTPLPLNSPDGRGMWAMIYDAFPQGAVCLAGAWVVVRQRTRAALAVWVFGMAALCAAWWLLTRVEIDKMPIENHRFWMAPLLALPVCGLYWFREAKDVFPKFLVVAGLGMAALSSAAWIYNPATRNSFCTVPARYKSPYDFYKVDCKKLAGASLGDKIEPVYLEAPAAYLYAGCSPTFTAGPTHRVWKDTAIGAASSGIKALQDLHENMVPPGAPLDVVCMKRKSTDPICAAARKSGPCEPAGRELERCSLSAADRAALLGETGADDGSAPDDKNPDEPPG